METADDKVERLRGHATSALDEKRYVQALTALSSALYLRPTDPDLHEQRGDAYLGICDVQSALLNYRRAVKLSQEEDGAAAISRETARRHELLMKALDLRAVALLDEGSFSEVSALTRVPHFMLCVASRRAVPWSQALLLLSEAIALNTDEPSVLLHRALAHSCLEQYAEALQDLDACAKGHPPSADVHYLRAKLHLLRKELPAARAAVRHAT
jgi:regulator of sirC expression with transglutaminase-like and TPR domain